VADKRLNDILSAAEKSTPALVSTKNRHHGVNVWTPYLVRALKVQHVHLVSEWGNALFILNRHAAPLTIPSSAGTTHFSALAIFSETALWFSD
jgi:hypothetical protein